jgi:multisubunit Na+/H+ antiporter MnhC subunit
MRFAIVSAVFLCAGIVFLVVASEILPRAIGLGLLLIGVAFAVSTMVTSYRSNHPARPGSR